MNCTEASDQVLKRRNYVHRQRNLVRNWVSKLMAIGFVAVYLAPFAQIKESHANNDLRPTSTRTTKQDQQRAWQSDEWQLVGWDDVDFGGDDKGDSAASNLAAINPHSPDNFTDTKGQPWVTVKMHRVFADGAKQEVELLRPQSWVGSLGLSEGADFEFAATERTFDGTFRIDDIGLIEKDLGPLEKDGTAAVTGTFKTENSRTYTLILQDGTEIRGTSEHPLYSLDRNDWVGLAEMLPGERLRTQDGQAVVQRVTKHPERETVYNLEVHGMHQYFVGEAQALSHNVGCRLQILRERLFLDGPELQQNLTWGPPPQPSMRTTTRPGDLTIGLFDDRAGLTDFTGNGREAAGLIEDPFAELAGNGIDRIQSIVGVGTGNFMAWDIIDAAFGYLAGNTGRLRFNMKGWDPTALHHPGATGYDSVTNWEVRYILRDPFLRQRFDPVRYDGSVMALEAFEFWR